MSSPVNPLPMATKYKMELWGSGFNAHGQLRCVDKYTESAISPETEGIVPHERLDATQDLFQFRKIAEGNNIKVLYAGWCQTILFVDQHIVVLGSSLLALGDGPITDETKHESNDQKLGRGETRDLLPQITLSPTTLNPTSAFGTASHGLQGFINPEPNVVWKLNSLTKIIPGHLGGKVVVEPAASFYLTSIHKSLPGSHLFAVATSSDGTTAAVFTPRVVDRGLNVIVVQLFDDLDTFLETRPDPSTVDPSTSNVPQHKSKIKESISLSTVGHPVQFAAYATGFILLTSDGNVWTWGDKRFQQSLGRTVVATKPGLVEGLVGCKIVKVAAGGWMCGCVSEAGEAWIWGSNAPGSDEALSSDGVDTSDARAGITPLIGLTQGEIAKIQLPLRPAEMNGSTEDDEEESIVDIAIGDGHVLVLDSNGTVWCCGRNVEGQLGILRGNSEVNAKFEKDWVKIEAFEGWAIRDFKVTGVVCGDLASFAILEREEIAGDVEL